MDTQRPVLRPRILSAEVRGERRYEGWNTTETAIFHMGDIAMRIETTTAPIWPTIWIRFADVYVPLSKLKKK